MRSGSGYIISLVALVLSACGSGGSETDGDGDNPFGDGDGDGDGDAITDAGLGGAGDGDGDTNPHGNGGTGNGGTNGNAGNGGNDPNECAAVESEAELAAANFLFVIDKSGSMNFAAEGDTQGRTRWEATREALGEALNALENEPNVRVGITLFPVFNTVLQCTLPETPAVEVSRLNAAHRALLDQTLDAVVPSGDTPIGGTMMYSYEFLRQQIVEQGTLSGNTFVVLFTDGAETCDQDAIQSLVDENTAKATLFDMRTFVIGAPGSESERGRLSQIAFEGNTATADDCDHSGGNAGDCHFDMTEEDNFAEALSDALAQIAADRSVRCDFRLPEDDQIDPKKVNVTYTNSETGEETVVLQDAEGPCDGANGWQYSEDFTRILLCGEICDQVVADPEGEVKIALGCKTESIR